MFIQGRSQLIPESPGCRLVIKQRRVRGTSRARSHGDVIMPTLIYRPLFTITKTVLRPSDTARHRLQTWRSENAVTGRWRRATHLWKPVQVSTHTKSLASDVSSGGHKHKQMRCHSLLVVGSLCACDDVASFLRGQRMNPLL